MNTFLKWIIISSSDPEKASMTIKGILLQWMAIGLAVCSVFHLPMTQNMAYQLITDISGLIGGLLGVFGLGRKIYYEIWPRSDYQN